MTPGVAGVTALVIITSSLNEHPELVAVHRNVFDPIPIAVTLEVGEVGVVIVAVPLTRLHVPVPKVMVFPARFVDDEQIDWSVPAFGTVGVLNV
jgi:hypothetical protein